MEEKTRIIKEKRRRKVRKGCIIVSLDSHQIRYK